MAQRCICSSCDLQQSIPPVPLGASANCRRCANNLRFTWPASLGFAQVASAAALLMLLVGSTTTLAIVERAGQRHTAGLIDGPFALGDHGLWELSLLVAFTSVVAPFLSTFLLLATLTAIRAGKSFSWLAAAFTWRNRLRPWSMIEVYLVGYFVAYSKLSGIVRIDPGPALLALIAFMILTIAIDAVLDPQQVWEAMTPKAAPDAGHSPAATMCCTTCFLACPPGQRCPRCQARLHRRKPNSVARTAALASAALVLYVPANTFPVLTAIQYWRGQPATILGEVWDLFGSGDYPLAVIVFLASITVPVLKILGLAAMLAFTVGLLPRRAPRNLTKLYRFIATIGRWSMVDIFMEAILTSLVKFGAVATVTPGPGALAFAAVVLLTIFAADGFDPRLMWDRFGAQATR